MRVHIDKVSELNARSCGGDGPASSCLDLSNLIEDTLLIHVAGRIRLEMRLDKVGVPFDGTGLGDNKARRR